VGDGEVGDGEVGGGGSGGSEAGGGRRRIEEGVLNIGGMAVDATYPLEVGPTREPSRMPAGLFPNRAWLQVQPEPSPNRSEPSRSVPSSPAAAAAARRD
jgi:hypothetical protein